MRPYSTDAPSQVPQMRTGEVRRLHNGALGLYTVVLYDGQTCNAYYSGTTALAVGAVVRVRYDPEKRFHTVEA